MNYEIKECICCWYDLLGFGLPFVESSWDLEDSRCEINVHRITEIKDRFYGSSALGLGKSFILNDGVINTMDIMKTESNTLFEVRKFLGGLINDFSQINAIEKEQVLPGIRGVITCGQRYDYIDSDYMYLPSTGEIITYYPKEFQMNTAFSKAYIMEESGSKYGISGSFLYIDKIVLNKIKWLLDLTKDYTALHVEEVANSNSYTFNLCLPDNKVFFGMRFDAMPIRYDNKGIKTELYRLKHYVCCIYAPQGAYLN